MSTTQSADAHRLLKYDMVIVGGGPAGCMTAVLMHDNAVAGTANTQPIRMAIIEKTARPMQRPCGEFLSPEGLRILQRVGVLEALMATGAQPLYGLDLVSGNRRLGSDYVPFCGCTPDFPHGLGLRREHLDSVLQEACRVRGITIMHDCRCASMEQSAASKAWIIDAESSSAGRILITAAMVVGADGRHSRVRHWAGLNKAVTRKRYGVTCRASGIPCGHHGEMHLGPLGQVGLAPIGNGEVNLNILLSPHGQKLLQKFGAAGCMKLALQHTESLQARCADARLQKMYATSSLPQDSSRVAAVGLALVGDAAGFCDPFTGEGMCIALQSAEMLADHLSAWTAENTYAQADVDAYARSYARHFGWRRRLVAGIQRLLDRRVISERIIRIASWSKYAARVAISLTGDYVHFGGARKKAP